MYKFTSNTWILPTCSQIVLNLQNYHPVEPFERQSVINMVNTLPSLSIFISKFGEMASFFLVGKSTHDFSLSSPQLEEDGKVGSCYQGNFSMSFTLRSAWFRLLSPTSALFTIDSTVFSFSLLERTLK